MALFTKALASGKIAVIDPETRNRVVFVAQDHLEAEEFIYGPTPDGCECEVDWSCPLHAGQATWLETRYVDEDKF